MLWLGPGIVCALTIVPCGIVRASDLDDARRTAIETIHKSGGWFFFGDELTPDGFGLFLDYSPANAGRLDRASRRLGKVVAIELGNSNAGDDELRHVADLTEARYLNLTNCNVTDAGIRFLLRLSELESLRIDGTKADDNAVAQLVGFKRLKGLSISHTNVSDKGLSVFPKLASLRFLLLDGTTISDNGLRQLELCTGLEFLSVENTRATRGGVTGLSRAIPKCRVRFDGDIWLAGKIDHRDRADVFRGRKMGPKGPEKVLVPRSLEKEANAHEVT
jgi:hypothetical protein